MLSASTNSPLADILDPGYSSALLKTHILTGCNFTSKVGSKLSSISAEPEKVLYD